MAIIQKYINETPKDGLPVIIESISYYKQITVKNLKIQEKIFINLKM